MNCKDELLELRNANRDTKRDEIYLDWRYLKRPCQIEPIIVWAHSNGGEVVGALSLVPHHYSIYNKECTLGVLGDISVVPKWRGKGVAREMFQFLDRLDEVKRLKGCVVLPNKDAAKPLERSGWLYISPIERYVKAINVEYKIRSLLKPKWLSSIVCESFNKLLYIFSAESLLRVPNNYEGEIVSRIDDRFDALWNNFNKREIIIGCRNQAYLRWRYLEHPLIKYSFFTLKNSTNELLGYIVFHIKGDTVYISDLLCGNGHALYAYLLFYFLQFVRNAKQVSKVTIGISKNDLCTFPLRWFGFFNRSDHQEVMISFEKSGQDNILFNKNKWFLTAGDKDT